MVVMRNIINGYENFNSFSFWSWSGGLVLYLCQRRKLAGVAWTRRNRHLFRSIAATEVEHERESALAHFAAVSGELITHCVG